MPYEIDKINPKEDLDKMDKIDFYLVLPSITFMILSYFLNIKFLAYIGLLLCGVFIGRMVIKFFKSVRFKRVKSECLLDS